jgi:acetylornithine deacetylase/succinyl-diaminopimelate desuccinylase-like protein
MAVAFRQLADSGFKPKGTISYLAVADEEARGVWGADWLIDHELDDVKADYVITESGGFQVPTANGVRLPVMVEEKGTYWSKLTIHGTPGHASSPYKTDNALITAAEVVRRLAEFRPPPELSGTWRRLVEGLGLPDELLVEESFRDTIDQMPLGFGRIAHSCTHTTFAPTVVHGGTKTNVIPDEVQIEVDIRTLPGQSGEHAEKLLLEAIGDLIDKVDIESGDDPSSRSEIDTPLWDALGRVTARLCEGSALVPWLMTGATDNRFFRRAGSVGYGFGLFSKKLAFEDYATMFHGNDERVDQESLGLSTDLWLAIAEEFVGPHSG